MWQTLTLLVGVGGLLLVAGGCGSSSTVPVEGVVTLDGQPLEGAAVELRTGGRAARRRAKTDAAGKFKFDDRRGGQRRRAGQVQSGREQDGEAYPRSPVPAVPPARWPDGQVLCFPVRPPARKGPPPMPKSLVPAKYVNPNTSEITVVVEKGMAPVQIELKSK